MSTVSSELRSIDADVHCWRISFSSLLFRKMCLYFALGLHAVCLETVATDLKGSHCSRVNPGKFWKCNAHRKCRLILEVSEQQQRTIQNKLSFVSITLARTRYSYGKGVNSPKEHSHWRVPMRSTVFERVRTRQWERYLRVGTLTVSVHGPCSGALVHTS